MKSKLINTLFSLSGGHFQKFVVFQLCQEGSVTDRCQVF